MKLSTNLPNDPELSFTRSRGDAYTPTLVVKVPQRHLAWGKLWSGECTFTRSQKVKGMVRFNVEGGEVLITAQNTDEHKWLDAWTGRQITVKVTPFSITFGIRAMAAQLNEAASMVTPQVSGVPARYDQLAIGELLTEMTRRGLDAYRHGKPLAASKIIELLRADDAAKKK